MPETPHKIRAKVDDAIRELNANWDLQLLSLHGGDAEAAEQTSLVAKRCAGRLRYLSFRLESLDELLRDFDSNARTLYSKWTLKPAQERGTLPILPVTKSFLHRDITRRRVLGLHTLSKEQRDKLLDLLDNTLKDDYELARSSDSYERTSGAASRAPSGNNSATRRHSPRLSKSTSTSTSPQTHQQNAAIISLPTTGAVVQQPTKMARKRTSGELTQDQSKRQRSEDSKRSRSEDSKQTKLQFGRRSSSGAIPPQPPPNQSFNTASSSPSEVFDSEPRSNTSSAATSILGTEQSTDYFPTQNDAGLWDSVVESGNSSSVTVSFSAEDIPQKLHATFVAQSSRLPAGLPFEYLYELQSLSSSWDLSPLDIFKQVEKLCRFTVPSADERWEAFKKLKPPGSRSVHEVFGHAWSPSRGSGQAVEPNRSTYLAAALEWTTRASDPTLFKVALRGPTTNKSCRFHRIFGGDRFLILHIPFIQRGDLPTHLRSHASRLHNEVVQWLASSEHNIGGRQWRAFWVDDSPPKSTKDKASFNRVHLFAVSGVGLNAPNHDTARPDRRPMPIEDFINFHTPISANVKSTNLKLFARFKLGLSKTVATVVLQQKHFRVVPDKTSSDGNVMNDGCGLMSPTLARDIARQLGLSEIPSAFQGRISGAKGLWIVDYTSIQNVGIEDYWIEVSPSQLKVSPHPFTREACDEYRQFEVTDWSKPPQQPSLNTQFLTVLADRGVPPKVLEQCLREHIEQYYYSDLRGAMSDSRSLLSWLQQYHRAPRNNDEVESSGAFPRDRTEKINMLLYAAFHAQDRYAPIRELLSGCLKDYLTWWADRLKITIMESTFLFCAPDPSGKLEENEVHCVLSEGWTSKTGAFSACVAGVDGLVARNPANHPSDIQRVKLVFRPELQGFRDVMFFSTKGQRSLASRLSGGDYDGDQCWLCWRQDLVSSFANYGPGPPDHITTQSCGLIERAERLTTIISNGKLNAESATIFLSGCFDFNLKAPMVGICTNEHEKVVYHRSLQDPGAIKLAALAAFLVDARKQGLELTEDVWHQIRAECSGQTQLPKPAWKIADTATKIKESNIIDRLRFRVARVVVDKALKHFSDTWPRGLEYDSYFASTSIKAWDRAEKNKNGNKTTLLILRKLKEDIQAVGTLWQQLTAGRADDNPGSHPQSVAVCFEQYRRIQPLQTVEEDEIHRRHGDETGRRFSYWNLLRASCFYREFPTRMVTWYMIGEELCFLQAERSGSMRSIAGPMYAVTKIDGRAVKSRMASSMVDDSEQTDTSFTGPICQYFDSCA